MSHPAQAGPLIVLVGRPNVGKSTLFNRLTHSRRALVADVPGTTRDWRDGAVEHGGYRFRLVDTGGMGFGMDLGFSQAVEAQIEHTLAAADAVWMVLDGRAGFNPYDAELFRRVERLGKPYQVLVNKMDSPGRRAGLGDFFALGTERVHAVSAAHGVGLDDVLLATAQELPGMRLETADEGTIAEGRGEGEAGAADRTGAEALRVAFLGRPNVGKSSLLNRVLGRTRMIVSEQAGTTREAVEVPFAYHGQDFVLVDTAGIRRRARTEEHLEKLGVLHSLGALRWVQVAVLVVDASEEPTAQDARIASTIVAQRRAVVVAMNKWDRIGKGVRQAKAAEMAVRERLRFLDFAAFVPTSALDGWGMERIFREVQRAARQYGREVKTADLNRVVQAATVRVPPPGLAGSPTRVYYGVQVGREPPAFRFFTSHPRRIDEAYTRYFENQLRHHFGFEGTPLRIEWRGRGRGMPEGAPTEKSNRTGRKAKGRPAKPRSVAKPTGRRPASGGVQARRKRPGGAAGAAAKGRSRSGRG